MKTVLLFGCLFKLTNCVLADVNLALKRPAWQSSTYIDPTATWPAALAVDGNADTNVFDNHCAHGYDPPAGPNWLVVDLGQQYYIQYVVLTNRGSCCPERLDYFIVGVTNTFAQNRSEPVRGNYSLCGQYPNKAADGGILTLYCNASTPSGRYVIIQQPTDGHGYLTICELQVFGNYDCFANKSFCGENEECQGIQNQIRCECQPGYNRTNTVNCSDINECELDNGGCDSLTHICVNTVGSFRCDCRTGFCSSSPETTLTTAAWATCADTKCNDIFASQQSAIQSHVNSLTIAVIVLAVLLGITVVVICVLIVIIIRKNNLTPSLKEHQQHTERKKADFDEVNMYENPKENNYQELDLNLKSQETNVYRELEKK